MSHQRFLLPVPFALVVCSPALRRTHRADLPAPGETAKTAAPQGKAGFLVLKQCLSSLQNTVDRLGAAAAAGKIGTSDLIGGTFSVRSNHPGRRRDCCTLISLY